MDVSVAFLMMKFPIHHVKCMLCKTVIHASSCLKRKVGSTGYMGCRALWEIVVSTE